MPVETRIEELELACAGMWERLKNRLDCTDEDLEKAIQSTVKARRVAQTRETGEPSPSCGKRLLYRRSPKCSWCGHNLHEGLFGS